ncbi:MAG: glycosyltransferase [Verrucomicrobia bacterium]|nr:glycosyltransferase [Verrucomicrobiota bacterium]
MPKPLLLDLSHTSHTLARTGIQRVARSLRLALGDAALAVTHDPHVKAWRALKRWELANLAMKSTARMRGARWPLSAKFGGRARRLLGRANAALPENSGLIEPEVFSPAVARALPGLFALAHGPRVAVFHDAIVLKFPELSASTTVARFPAYLGELLAFDGIAAVSEDSRTTLLDYWRWLGAKHPPPVQAIPLGVDLPGNPIGYSPAGGAAPAVLGVDLPGNPIGYSPAGGAAPVVLSVGSIEGRKNHLALVEACEELWARGVRFTLHLVGLAHAQTGRAALARIRQLQGAGRPLRYDGPVADDALATAYATCVVTVYPSLIEGFGLPVIESLAHGKPCVCSAGGALGESARGGGCVALDTVDARNLAGAIGRLLAAPAELSALTAAARSRRFKTWADYAAELTTWMRGLR